MIKNLFKNKEFNNASWLIFGRVIQLVLSLFVSILTARYLGPSNKGLIDYASAYVLFFTAFCVLGLNSVLVKDFIDKPEERGLAIGSALVMRLVSSVLSAIMIILISTIVDYGETETIIVVALCSLGTIFNVFETFNFWFQAQYKSRVTSIVMLIAYAVMSAYRVVLLVLGKDVYWFALATSVEYAVVAIALYVAYKIYHGPKLRFSFKKCKQLLKSSYHFILPSLMIAIYNQVDKIMLKNMVDTVEVGYYSTAVTLTHVWGFVLTAMIDSIVPTILRLKNQDENAYKKKNMQLYSMVFYTAIFVAVLYTIFGDLVIEILYGEEFMGASMPLKILPWLTAFSYLGGARSAWVVSENKQKYLKYINVTAVFTNVILNLVLIPFLGASGAAIASLVTQMCVCIIVPLMIKPMRENAILMIRAINPKYIFSAIKSLFKKNKNNPANDNGEEK